MKLICTLVLALGFSVFATAKDEPTAEAIAGSYLQRLDFADRNITLILQQDGHYEATYVTMMMVVGKAKGSWTTKDGNLILTPSEEKNGLKGFLTTLRIRRVDDDFAFLREEEEKEKITEELKVKYYFRKIVARQNG